MSQHAPTLPSETTLPENHLWRKLPKIGGVIGAIGIVASLALMFTGDESLNKRFYYSYLTAYMYFLSISLGALFFVLVHHATKAGWNITVRRIAEKLAAVLPLMAILFIPVIVGMSKHMLFTHWDAAHAANDPIVQGKSGYLNVTFFYIRAAIYFCAWIGISRWYLGCSMEQDTTGDEKLTRRMTGMSYPSIAIFSLTLTFAAFDWIMSHDPHWYSTMYGVYYFAGSLVGIFATMCILAVHLRTSDAKVGEAITIEHQHDLGKYLFAFVVFWTYIAFSQYMLIWYANIPEETLWFAHRGVGPDGASGEAGGWHYVSQLLVFGHFLFPFLFLMSRHMKRNNKTLVFGACWLLLMHYVDLFYQIMPNVSHHGPNFSRIDFTTMLAVGGLFIAYFGKLISEGNLVPTKDPRLTEALSFENFPTNTN